MASATAPSTAPPAIDTLYDAIVLQIGAEKSPSLISALAAFAWLLRHSPHACACNSHARATPHVLRTLKPLRTSSSNTTTHSRRTRVPEERTHAFVQTALGSHRPFRRSWPTRLHCAVPLFVSSASSRSTPSNSSASCAHPTHAHRLDSTRVRAPMSPTGAVRIHPSVFRVAQLTNVHTNTAPADTCLRRLCGQGAVDRASARPTGIIFPSGITCNDDGSSVRTGTAQRNKARRATASRATVQSKALTSSPWIDALQVLASIGAHPQSFMHHHGTGAARPLCLHLWCLRGSGIDRLCAAHIFPDGQVF